MTDRLPVYVDSAEEQLSFLLSKFGPRETWSVEEQRIATGRDGIAVERATVRTTIGPMEIEFRDAHLPELIVVRDVADDRSDVIDRIMERASTFAAENPPHHPGSITRFPVPVKHYDHAVAVPLPILAVDDHGRRGLYAPPRMAVISWDTIEPVGVREIDGFDPEQWPPVRLGDWPAPTAVRLAPQVLEASVVRFGACWSRIIDGWFAHLGGDSDVPDSLPSDIDDALRLRAVLELPAMSGIYESINPRFVQWLKSNTSRGT
jgi:hypothetical protein